MAKSLSPKWRPFLQLSSREKKSATAIYVEPAGKTIRMMIALIERNEIGVVQMELDAKDIKRLAANLGGKTKEIANLHQEK